MRTLFLIVTLACVQFGCGHDNPTLVRGNLNDAVKRHASIDERIMEWGAPSGKETSTEAHSTTHGNSLWSEEQILPDGTAYPIQHGCTVVITTSSDNAIQSYKTDDC